jgi:hypothetical protein
MADTTHLKNPPAAPRRARRRASPARSRSARKSASASNRAAARQPDPQNSVARARAALGKAGAASKKTIDRLLKEWRRMDTSRKLQFTAALLGALAAAAAAPVVRSRMKKR